MLRQGCEKEAIKNVRSVKSLVLGGYYTFPVHEEAEGGRGKGEDLGLPHLHPPGHSHEVGSGRWVARMRRHEP